MREVSEETIAIGLWEKLETIYMKKSLANRLYLKKRLYTLQIDEPVDLRKHLDEFKRIILDRTAIGVEIDQEDQCNMLLSSLPKAYEHFVDTMLYGNDKLTMDEVRVALNSKELQRKTDSNEPNGDSLSARERSDKIETKNGEASPDQSLGPPENVFIVIKKDISRRTVMKGSRKKERRSKSKGMHQ